MKLQPIRCSALHRLLTNAKSIDDALLTPELSEIKAKRKRTDEEQGELNHALNQTLSATARELVEEMLILQKYGIYNFKGNRFTEKGNIVEDDAITFLMQHEGIFADKNTERLTDGVVTGEWDIFYNRIVYDTKCPWDFFTMPKTQKKVESAVKDAGYDIQQIGYMRLLKHHGREVNHAEIKYTLMPTPQGLLYPSDDAELHIDFVESLPPEKRIRTHRVEWCEKTNELIDLKFAAAQAYAELIYDEL
mgnify:FL=1